MIALEANLTHLLAADAARIGGGVDPSDQRAAVEGVVAGVRHVLPGFVGWQSRPTVAQHGHHAPIGLEDHQAHRPWPVRRGKRLAGIVTSLRFDQTPRTNNVRHRAFSVRLVARGGAALFVATTSSRLVPKSLSITAAALRPGPAEIEPPGCVVKPIW